jgi:hypothetical protein
MLISFLLVAVLVLVFYFIFNNKEKKAHSNNVNSQDIDLTASNALKAKNSSLEGPPVDNCHIHKEVSAQAFCSICKLSLCENCVLEDENLYFCSGHFQLYLNEEWVELETIITTPNNSEDGMYIYEFHETIWNERQIPTFITTHYKIDVESDHIQSEVKLMVRIVEKDHLKIELSNTIKKAAEVQRP